jgi:hypothetical protein
MRAIKTYRKVGAFYIACEEDFSTSIRFNHADVPIHAVCFEERSFHFPRALLDQN